MNVTRRARNLDANPLNGILDRFLAEPTWAGSRRLVERHLELLDPIARDRLRQRAARARYRRDDESAIAYDHCRYLLARCAEAGVATAFAEIPSPTSDAVAPLTAPEERVVSHANAGVMVVREYLAGGPPDALATGVAHLEAALVAATGTTYRPDVLANLGYALLLLHQQDNRPDCLDRAITLLDDAVAATPPAAGDRVKCLTNLAGALLSRLDLTNDRADLVRASQLVREATRLADSSTEPATDRCSLLTNVGSLHWVRFTLWRRLSDLRLTVSALQSAAAHLRADDPRQGRYLTNLGIALSEIALHSDAEGTLDESIGVLEEALRSAPGPAGDLAARLANLATARAYRYDLLGNDDDLSTAIQLFEAAVAALPPANPDRAAYLGNLGIVLRDRAIATGSLADLDSAIARQEEAVALTAPAAPLLAIHLDQLGTSLRLRGLRGRDLRDVQRALGLQKRAVRPTWDRADRPGRLNNLAGTVRAMFTLTGDAAHLGRAVEAYRQAVAQIGAGSPDESAARTNLGAGLLDLYEATGDFTALDEAFRELTRALADTPPGAPELASRWNNLANARYHMWLRTGDLKDLDAGRAGYRTCCELAVTGRAQDRLIAGRNWGAWAVQRSAWAEAAEAYAHAAAGLDTLVAIQHLRPHKENWLTAGIDVAAEYAYVLMRCDQPVSAVIQLENSRTRLLAGMTKSTSPSLTQHSSTSPPGPGSRRTPEPVR